MLQRIRDWLRSDMKVLRWVFLALYVALIVGLSWPIFWQDVDGFLWWLVLLAVFIVAQALLIFGAGTVNLCHPIRRRRLWMPVLAASFMLGLLVLGLTVAMMELVDFDPTVLGLPDAVVITGIWFYIIGSWLGWGLLLWSYAQR